MDKLRWLNHEYIIKEADDERLAKLIEPRLKAKGADLSRNLDLVGIVALLKEREATLVELAEGAVCSSTEIIQLI